METSSCLFVFLSLALAYRSTADSVMASGEALYQQLIQDLGRDTAKLRSISSITTPSTNATSRLYLIQNIDQDNRVLEQISSGTGGPSSGPDCLSINKKVAKDIAELLKLADSDLHCDHDPASTEEGHYACVLQQEACHLNKILAAANSTTSDSSSGQYQNLIVKLAKDIATINEVINNNDTSSKCQEASKELGKDLLAIRQSVPSE